MPTYVAFDTETWPIGPCNVAPPPVCLTIAEWPTWIDDRTGPYYEQFEVSIFPKEDIVAVLTNLLENPDVILVGQFSAFDSVVSCGLYPELFPLLFKAYDENRIHCIGIREKLINISTIGMIDKEELPDGGARHLGYGLKDFAMNYLGLDMFDEKNSEDSWRTNFCMLDGKPLDQWPQEAKDYAMNDARITLAIHHEQELKAKELGAVMTTHEFRAKADFALLLSTCDGMEIDLEEKQKVQDMISGELTPDRLNLLIEAGILTPAKPPREYAKSPGKFTKGEPEHIRKAPLQELIVQVCTEHGLPIIMTDGGQKQEPKPSTADAVMQEIAHLHPTLEQYQHRQSLQKLVTTELPRMSAPIIHASFDILKKTGRTSSRASELYPSFNGQNVDPRVRPCFKAPDGWLYLSVDYSSIELVTLAQKLIDLFGSSTHANMINSGKNPHDYLGAQMALNFDTQFQDACKQSGCESKDDAYELFKLFKTDENKDVREFFKKYRTFAKPTGLGYPGGLGAKTFVTYAKGTFGVVITEEQAVAFREVWFDTHPDMHAYFKWVTEQADPHNPGMLGYYSPLGMYRANCSYTECANGAALQTPAAEGGLWAYYQFTKACYNHAEAGPLYGCKPKLWIHDEILCQIPDDEFAHERACMLQQLMIDCMREITPDVQVSTEAKLMRRWYKEAQPAFDTQGRLIPWEPTQTD